MELACLGNAPGTQPAANQQFKDGVADMSQSQSGEIPDLVGGHGKFKIILQSGILQ